MNEIITVKFGTPEPIKFREYDEKHPEIDLDLEFRAAGLLSVTDLGSTSFGSGEEAVSKLREIALSSIEDCARTWPEGVSFWNNTTKTVLEKNINERLFERSITARTDLFSLALTSESRVLYDAAVKKVTEQRWVIDIMDRYKDVIEGNEGQPKTGQSNLVRPLMGKNPFTPSSNDGGFVTDKNTLTGIDPNGSPINMSGDKYCRNCGAKREGDGKFCSDCGAKFD